MEVGRLNVDGGDIKGWIKKKKKKKKERWTASRLMTVKCGRVRS